MGPGDANDADDRDEGVAIEMPAPTAAPAQVRAAAKARMLAASLGTSNPTPERERIAGRYRLVREIGRGGIGSVWEAELAPIGKRMAIKLLRSRTGARAGEHEARLLREAQAASAIGHEHIVRIDDFGIDPDAGPFLVMELLHGRSLATEIEVHAPMAWPRVVGILAQLCSALAAAHRIGIVHRDLKPANVFLVRREGGADDCKLLDFGLCKPPSDSEDAAPVTAMGTRMGTPGYMAPEQIRGEEVDGRADLYALGCIAYEMLCGRPPFTARRATELVAAHLGDTPPDLGERVPGLPPAVARVVARAMEKDREQRFDDAEAFARELVACGIDGRPVDRTMPAAGREPRATTPEPIAPRRRSPVVLALAVLGAGALAMIAARDDPAPDAAELASTVVEPAAPIETPPVAAPPLQRAEPRTATAAVIPAAVPEPTPVAPVPTPTSRRAPRRAAAEIAEPAPVPPPPTPLRTAAPAPEPRPVLVDGIRDPFGAHAP